MPIIPAPKIEKILSAAADLNISISDFLIGLLSTQQFNEHAKMLVDQVDLLLDKLQQYDERRMLHWATSIVIEKCEAEMIHLSEKESALHFGASETTEEKLQTFDTAKITLIFQTASPCLWSILGHVLNSETHAKYQRDYSRKINSRNNSQKSIIQTTNSDGDVDMRSASNDGLGIGYREMEDGDLSPGADAHHPWAQPSMTSLQEYRWDQLLDLVSTCCFHFQT